MVADLTRLVRAAKKGASRGEWLSEDSVDAEFGGGAISEGTIETVRSLGPKGAALGRAEPEELAELLPGPSQADIEAAQQELQDITQHAEALKEYKLSAADRERIDYKRQLTEGLSRAELAWVKQRAWLKGTTAAQTGSASSAAERCCATASTSGSSPLDAERAAVLGAVRAALVPSSEEGGDTEEAWSRVAAASSAASPDFLHVRLPSAAVDAAIAAATSRYPEDDAEPAAASAQGNASARSTKHKQPEAPTIAPEEAWYRDDFQEELRLSRQLAAQRRQRSGAFVVSFAAAASFCLVKWLRSRGRGKGQGGGAGGQAAGKRTPSVSLSVQ